MTDEPTSLQKAQGIPDTDDGWVPLHEAEPGVHETRDGSLLFKNEYTTRDAMTGFYRVDAYVLSTGEYWWGGHKDPRQRDAELVRPVDVAALLGRSDG